VNGISIKGNRIIFYGNTAGYVDGGRAVVDPIFQSDELKAYLTDRQGLEIDWINGVYDRLANHETDEQGNIQALKDCRIYQLKPDVDVRMKFIGYDELKEKFGDPALKNYDVAYDGQIETNDLEQIFEKFNTAHPPGFTGHSLSMSDIVELYDPGGSTFQYVDRFGFRQIEFSPPQQGQTMGM
jgi:hypothetical protein